MPKYISNFILIIISLTISRLVFYFINDPEGPNLLIVTLLAIVIFSILYLVKRIILKKSKSIQ